MGNVHVDLPAWVMMAAGLIIYPLTMAHPSTGAYGMVAIPFMGLVCFWIHVAWQKITSLLRRVIGVFLVIIAVTMLLTNRLFVIYPHLWQPTGERFAKERQFYQQWFNFDEEAALIKKFQPNGPVAILSSFEVGILQTAHRSPLLPHAPLIASTLPMDSSAGGLRIKTKKEAMDVLKEMDQWSPSFFFIDKKTWSLSEQQMAGMALAVVMEQVHRHYEPLSVSKYLIVLKKKE